MENITIATDKLIALTDNKDNSGLYTITHPKDTTLQIGNDKDITEYRYRGASPKNYVTFNNETWRILGVFPTDDGTGNIENRIKLIRNESIGNKYWNTTKVSSTNTYNNWTGATLKTELNETYLNALSPTAQNMIGDAKYYLGGGGNNSNFNSSVDFYFYERKIKNTKSNEFYYGTNPNSWVGKLGLMYVSDYGYASDNCETKALNDYNNSNDLRICNNTNWLFNLKKLEATITQYSNTSTSIHYIADNGTVVSTYQASVAQTVVRPTLYLKSEVRIIDGDGTSANPYTLGL